ncbi:MAG: aldo/keto reductase [Gammaproteobacteria bacterium]|nr:aldo/keto reductase [Gammaproteobacteria bacterium]
MELRPLGSTGLQVSPLGLGTVKFGRNQQVKYPRPFALPDDRAVLSLLALARDLGLNLLDTAPAYGSSQQRLGRLLGAARRDWVIVSKVGEVFADGVSRFDFSYAHTVASVEHSLRTLRTDYLDCVLVHSDGDDGAIFDDGAAIDALRELQRRGLVRAIGMSSKTVDGGLRTVAELDVVMATCNLAYNDELPVLEAAAARGKGVLIKKGLMSGHVADADMVERSFAHVFAQPGVSSMIVGTIDPAHLRDNVAALQRALESLA